MIADVVAGAGIVVGALLMALGAFGLLRFPDVFTRMHAATKAATVGVIATTAAAAVEAGAFGGVIVLLVVVALLFLSGPLGMSLLARAAYRDPETPRSPNTRDVAGGLPTEESIAAKPTHGASPMLGVWLFVVWVAAFGTAAPNVLVGGVVVAGTIAFLLRRFAPRWPEAFLHPVAAGRFLVFFTVQLVKSTWDVIWSLRLSPEELHPAVIEVPLRLRTRNEVTLLMNTISFTPGTVTLELHGEHLYVHVLNVRDEAEVLASIAELEDRIAAAFGARASPPAQ